MSNITIEDIEKAFNKLAVEARPRAIQKISEKDLCRTCMHHYQYSIRNHYGKFLGVKKFCGEDKVREVPILVTSCDDYSRGLAYQQCGFCQVELKDIPVELTANHGFCSRECKTKYINSKRGD